MAELSVDEARALQQSNPNFFRGAIDFTQGNHAITAALAGSIFKKYDNDRFVNCFDFAFNNPDATSQTKQRMMSWARQNGFVNLPGGHVAGHVDVWGNGDDGLTHASRLIDVAASRANDVWASAMGAGQDIVTHYRDSFAGGGYGRPIVSFVNFVNWNSGWMQHGQNFVGNIAHWEH